MKIWSPLVKTNTNTIAISTERKSLKIKRSLGLVWDVYKFLINQVPKSMLLFLLLGRHKNVQDVKILWKSSKLRKIILLFQMEIIK